MKNMRDYIAIVKPEHAQTMTDRKVLQILRAIAGITITRDSNGIFEFQATAEAYRDVKNKLRPWCIVQRERFLHEEGGESGA